MQQRLLIVTGKGGVGKSSMTAALAIQAARKGRRVLAIGMTESAGLASHLGREKLNYEPDEVRSGLFALAINRPEALDEYLRVQLGVPRVTRIGPIARAFDALASAAPGIRETVTMGKVMYEAQTNEWDLVVADAPPSGQIASHLRAPTTISDLVGVGKVREQVEWMQREMADPALTGLVLVSLAEELPVVETQETLALLDENALISVAAVYANRLVDPLGAKVPSDTTTPVGSAAALHYGIYSEQRKWTKQLGSHTGLPYLFGATGPPEVARRLADHLDQL